MMKKKIIFAVVAVLLLCGCEKTIPKLTNGDEVVVSLKDDMKISANDLYNGMKDKYALSVLLNMIDKKIFDIEFKDKMDDANVYAQNLVDGYKSGYEDNSKWLAALNNAGYKDEDAFKEEVVLDYLRNEANKKYAESQVKDSEINKYYKNEIVGDREVSHILIIPAVKDNMTDTEKKEQEDKALEKAKEVITKLKKGETFESLAKEYSEDEATKNSAGSLGYMNKGDYGSDAFDTEMYKLKVGTYSTTPVKTSKGYEVIYVTNEKDKKSLEEVKSSIVEKLGKEKLENDATMSVLGMRELRKQYGVDIVDDELNTKYNKYMNNAYNNAVESNSKK